MRKMTVVNACSYTVWPAIFTSVGPQPKDTPTGWEAAPGSSRTFEAMETWGGRVWGRTGCDFSDSSIPGALQCETGACNGGLECDTSSGTGVPPVSLAEFNLQTNVDNCECGKKNSAGKVVGCMTDCGANPQNQEYCCSGDHSTPETCPYTGIPHYDFWLTSCPISYIYAYGDKLALFTCTKRPDWTVTFCPGPDLYDKQVTFPDGSKNTPVPGLDTTATTSVEGAQNTADAAGTTAGGKTTTKPRHNDQIVKQYKKHWNEPENPGDWLKHSRTGCYRYRRRSERQRYGRYRRRHRE
ncbi:hypothetical protein JCM8202v2_002016 [Rhodotorula sphaerocarpa]